VGSTQTIGGSTTLTSFLTPISVTTGGAAVASDGVLRLPFAQNVMVRNETNDGDLQILRVTTGNALIVGNNVAGGPTQLRSTSLIQAIIGGGTTASFDANGLLFTASKYIQFNTTGGVNIRHDTVTRISTTSTGTRLRHPSGGAVEFAEGTDAPFLYAQRVDIGSSVFAGVIGLDPAQAPGGLIILATQSGAGVNGRDVAMVGGAGGTGDTDGGDTIMRAGAHSGSGTPGSAMLQDPGGGIGVEVTYEGTDTKVGLFAVAPVVQQIPGSVTTGFTAGSGTGVNVDSTFTGNEGGDAYTIGDIVRALKRLGPLRAGSVE
jgi:hypothetical protein